MKRRAFAAFHALPLCVQWTHGSGVAGEAKLPFPGTNCSCSLGIGIAKIENHGKGYGTQALQLILNMVF
jgi:RimJ/RimL family protein N-acetyltransferase